MYELYSCQKCCCITRNNNEERLITTSEHIRYSEQSVANWVCFHLQRWSIMFPVWRNRLARSRKAASKYIYRLVDHLSGTEFGESISWICPLSDIETWCGHCKDIQFFIPLQAVLQVSTDLSVQRCVAVRTEQTATTSLDSVPAGRAS